MHLSFHTEMDFVDYYHLSKKNEDLDDFSRLARLEIKLDDHMARYFELTNEMNKIEQDLVLIRREFQHEFKEYLLQKANAPTVELGEKILEKLDHYYTQLEETKAESEGSHSRRPSQQLTQPGWGQTVPAHQQQQPKQASSRPGKSTTSRSSYYQPREGDNHHKQHHLTKSQPQLNEAFPMDISAIPTTAVPTNNGTEVHKAHYVVIGDHDDEGRGTPTDQRRGGQRVSHHQSTPSITLPPPPQSPPPAVEVYQHQYQQPQQQHHRHHHQQPQHYQPPEVTRAHQPMYLNMAMSLHSGHPAIENTFRRIDLLRPRIMMYNAEHKLRSYHEMSHELSSLMAHLEHLAVGTGGEFEQDRNIALCELHNMIGMLERSIQCEDQHCVICNAFVFSDEVSV